MNIENIKVAGYTYPINDKDGETDILKILSWIDSKGKIHTSDIADKAISNDKLDANLQSSIAQVSNNTTEIEGLLYRVVENKNENTDFADKDGNVIMRLSSEGVLAKIFAICDNKGNIVAKLNDLPTKEDETEDFYFTDSNGYAICIIGKDGVMSPYFKVMNGETNTGFITHSSDGSYYFADANGNYSVCINKKGVFDVKAIGTNLTNIIKNIGGSGGGGGTVDDTSILSLNPSSEVLPKMQQMAHNPISGQKTVGTSFSFLFFSDIHYSTNNLERIIEFYNKYEAYLNGGMISGGDNINYYWSAQKNLYNEWLAVDGADKILSVVGNHDAWQSTWNDMAAQTDVYDRMFAPCVSKWGVTQPDDAATSGLMYWYKDYLNTANSSNGILGIRVIGLDCMHWDSTQKAWLTEVLQDAIDNSLAVVGVSHYAAGSLDRWDCSFDDKLNKIGTSTLLSIEAATCIDTFQKNGGEFICWLCGHTHNDFVGTLTKFPAQVNIVVSTASINSLQCAYCDASRVEGTRSQDLFDIVSFDTYNKLIKVCRIGCCYDHSMQYANTMNIQYKSSPSKTLDKVSGSTLDKPQLINC